MIIGDSEACAVGNYAQEVANSVDDGINMPHSVIEIDCKGSTTVQYWGSGGNFRAALEKHPRVDTVVIFLGTNHYMSVVTPPTKPILDIVKERNISCVWVGNVAVNGRHWRVNDMLRKAVEPTCTYFDSEVAAISLADGVHPTKAGAVKWLQRVWPLVPAKYGE
jgi:hypothetical protein